jgi:hypothetical protein
VLSVSAVVLFRAVVFRRAVDFLRVVRRRVDVFFRAPVFLVDEAFLRLVVFRAVFLRRAVVVFLEVPRRAVALFRAVVFRRAGVLFRAVVFRLVDFRLLAVAIRSLPSSARDSSVPDSRKRSASLRAVGTAKAERVKSCPLCGNEIVGRDAVEVLEEYRELVIKAREAEEIVGRVDEVADDLWRAAKRAESREEDDDSLAWVLNGLRGEARESSQSLGAAAQRYREALRPTK